MRGVVAQLARVLPCHGRGRGFESRLPRFTNNERVAKYGEFYAGSKKAVS